MVTNEWMMGYTTGIGAAASNLATLPPGFVEEGIRESARIRAARNGGQVDPASEWGKGKATVPEKPNVIQTLLGVGMELLPKFLEAKQAKKTEEEAAAKKKKDAAQKKIDDAAAEAKELAKEDREFQRKKELAQIEAGKETKK